MNHCMNRGFSFLDCLLALGVVLLGVSATFTVLRQASRAEWLFRERNIAMRILSRAYTLTPERLQAGHGQYFNVQGLPCETAGKYQLLIEVGERDGFTVYNCRVTYRDNQGVFRNAAFERLERDDEGL